MWGRASSTRERSGLAERRRRRRRRLFIASCILLLLLLTVALYGLRQAPVRISHVTIYDPANSEGKPLADIALAALRGSYLGIIPRDSILFYPTGDIRSAILKAHPEIAAISIFRNGLTGISLKIDERLPIARWCGLAPTDFTPSLLEGHGAEEYCYFFDAKGLVYAPAATTTRAVNAFSVYAPLAGGVQEPLGAKIADAERLPAAFDFARQLSTAFGAPVASVAFRDDEVDDRLASGTRVTYLLGDEENAYSALVSARANLNFSDGSLEYVDLRFPGKVYLKKM